jgi:hypothetical protein
MHVKKIIAVCGSDGPDDGLPGYALEAAERVGRLIAQHGGVLVCGGRGGIMRAACKGCKQEDQSVTIGILPYSVEEANEYVDIPVPTYIGYMRNFLITRVGDAVIAIHGAWGTLSEIASAMVLNKPVILIQGTGGCVDEIIHGRFMKYHPSSYYIARSAEDAVQTAFQISGNPAKS